MKILLVLLLTLLSASASKILSYNVYDRSDRVDVMFTFDTPYEGKIRQNRQQNRIVIKLSDAEIESPKIKELRSKFVSKLTIAPIGAQTEIIANVPTNVMMQASRTSDAYGLRLRFTKKVSILSKVVTPLSTTTPTGLPTKLDSDLDSSYYIVIAILLIGIVLMLWLKKRTSMPSSGVSKPWLFSAKSEPKEDVNIRFQKSIDQQNRVVMLEYGEESYLMVIGSSNVMLDKFHGNQIITQNEFDVMLQSKHEELDNFLQLDKNEESPLDTYKEKASGIDYHIN